MIKLISALAVLLLVVVGGARIISSQKLSTAEDQADATPIQVGVLTERQKQHSRLFNTAQYETGRKLDATEPGARGIEPGDGPYVGPPFEVLNPNAPVLSLSDFLGQMSCLADAVVVVQVKDKSSQLTENREFIFTDYNVAVKEVLKNNAAAELAVNGGLVVTRPGGKVKFNNRVVSALDSSFKPLEANHEYLLFLKYVPATGAYLSLRKGSFLLRDGALTKLTEEMVPGSTDQAQSFTDESRKAIQRCAH